MKERSPFTQSYEQLPHTLPVFPLNGAVVLPGGMLELNIFEPRYLNMVQDAIKSDQLIGMIQPKDELMPATLHSVGCAGRIIRFSETKDGRLEILLEGLCRFSVHEELSSMRGYRLIKPNWHDYQHDFTTEDSIDLENSQRLSTALRRYFNKNNIEVDWSTIERLPQDVLINNLVGQLALSTEDKQRLVEANSLSDRIKSFTAILTNHENDSVTLH